MLSRTLAVAALVVHAGLGLAACGNGASGGPAASAAGAAAPRGAGPETLRLGYLPNVTHATALAGIQTGTFAAALGPGTRLEPKAFGAGPEVVEALFAGALDASYIGPNPAINAFAQSGGRAIRIVAGATSGGASLVVRPGIASAADLKGRRVASPQLGNTQDVALRAWLASHGLATTTTGGGDVAVVPQANADALAAFRAGRIDGAWVPEPWATRLVREGGGTVLVDEADLWPGGRYLTTQLVVRTAFLDRHPDAVRRLLQGHVDTTALLTDPSVPARRAAQRAVNDGIEAATTTRLPDPLLDAAWARLVFTVDPLAATLEESADRFVALGFLDPVDLAGIYDLAPLNAVLAARGGPRVEGL